MNPHEVFGLTVRAGLITPTQSDRLTERVVRIGLPGGAVAPPAAAPPALQIPADQCERSGVAKLHALLSARVNRTVKALEKPQRAAGLSDDCCWRGCERLTELTIDAADYGIQSAGRERKEPSMSGAAFIPSPAARAVAHACARRV